MTLSPAEALVLLEPDGDNGIQAAKVTFLALLAEGVLKLEKVAGRIFGSTTRIALARQPAENPPHVAAVLDAVRASRAKTVPDVARRLSGATGRFAHFVPKLVRPRLVQRGLLSEHRHQEERRVLFFFRRTVTVTTWQVTEAGAREQARLRGMLDSAPEIRTALDENPGRAVAMAAALGPLLVLVPALLPVLGQLAQAMGLNPDLATYDSGGTAELSWASEIDAAAGGFSESLDSAMTDASSDSSSDSDSGGDGGGSDGGGSDGGGE